MSDPKKPSVSPAVAVAKTSAANDGTTAGDASAELESLKARIAELESASESVADELDIERARHRQTAALLESAKAHMAAAPVAVWAPKRKSGPVSVPGAGPYLWEGMIPKDSTSPRVRFLSHSQSAGDAKDEYLKHAGIVATPHPISVSRVDAE